MPKEHIHFRIAERTAALLADSRLGNDLATHRPALLLGAVFHDALFYLATPGRRETDALMELPHRLHGKKGTDPHALLRAEAAHARTVPAPSRPAARAFLVGMVAHLHADVDLHPMVYHFSGDYYNEAGAVERHRFLETCLDLAMAGSLAELRKIRIAALLRRCDPAPLAPVEFLARLSGCETAATRAALARGWKIFARMQGLGLSLPGQLGAALRPLLPSSWRAMREILALLYPPPKNVRPLLEQLRGTLSFRHPVSGLPHTATLQYLMEQSANKAAQTCLRLLPALFEHADPAKLLGTGPNLDTGLAGVDTTKARHFAVPRFPAV